MRLIIDISKNEYNDIIEQVKKRDYPDMGLGKIIANGTPYEERPQGEESDNLCDDCKISDTCALSLKGLTWCKTTKCFRYEWAKKEAENE